MNDHQDIENLSSDEQSLSGIMKFLTYVNVFHPNMLGAKGHEFVLFMQDLIMDNQAELAAARLG